MYMSRQIPLEIEQRQVEVLDNWEKKNKKTFTTFEIQVLTTSQSISLLLAQIEVYFVVLLQTETGVPVENSPV